MDNEIILIGNPNTGKTTLYNTLTNSNEHVGNWHGVTVGIKKKKMRNSQTQICDLPGIYSLNNLSYEEEIATNYIMQNRNKLIVNIVDANNLRQNLFLTQQLLDIGIKNIVIAINMAKEVCNINIVKNNLEKLLMLKVILIDARYFRECSELYNYINEYVKTNNRKRKENNNETKLRDNKKNNNNEKKLIIKNCFGCHKCKQLKGQGLISERKNNENHCDANNNAERNEKIDLKMSESALKIQAHKTHNKINEILKKCKYEYKKSANNKLNTIFYNKFLATISIFAVFLTMFIITFGIVGQSLSGLFSELIDKIVHGLFYNITSEAGGWLNSFLYDGVINGVSLVFSFLPQIVLLFIFIGVLEDSGILSRFAFMLNGILSKFGLDGKSFFSLLMGYGCTTSAVVTTRNLQDANVRKKTVLLLPNMPCSAKLPIFVCFANVFLPRIGLLAIVSLYVFSILIACFIGLILNKNNARHIEDDNFILEMPKLRFPRLVKILKDVAKNAKDFVIRVGSVIVLMSVLVWLVSNLTITLRFEPNSNMSILNCVGNILTPIFKPLGFGKPGIIVAVLCGLVAKEMLLGVLCSINSVNTLEALKLSLINPLMPAHFTLASALSFMVFVLFYPACISAFSAMKQEEGLRCALMSTLLQFTIAYIISLIFYLIFSLIEGVLLQVCILIVIVAFVIGFMIHFLCKWGKRGTIKGYNRQRNQTFEVV